MTLPTPVRRRGALPTRLGNCNRLLACLGLALWLAFGHGPAQAGQPRASAYGPVPEVTARGGRIYRGEKPFQVFEFQEETRLARADYSWSGYLGGAGVNSLWFIAYQVGGDNAPGIPEVDITAWDQKKLDYTKAWLSNFSMVQAQKGEGGIIHIAFSENEQRNIPWSKWVEIVDRTLYVVSESPFIACVAEEFPDSKKRVDETEEEFLRRVDAVRRDEYTALKARAEYLRSLGVPAISVHNPLHWHDGKGGLSRSNPLDELAGEGLIDIVAVQDAQEKIGSLSYIYHSLGYAVIVHEKTPATTGVDWRDEKGSVFWAWSGWTDSSGFSIYPGYWNQDCNDLLCEKPEVFDTLFRYWDISRRVQQSGGTPAAASFLGVPYLNIDFNGDGRVDAGDF